MADDNQYQIGSAEGRRNLAFILLLIAGYAAVVWSIHLYIEHRGTVDAARRYHWFSMDMALLGLSVAVLMFAEALWVWRHGRRIVVAQRAPAPGFHVPCRMKIKTGTSAVRQGRFLQVMACFLAVWGCAGLTLMIAVLFFE